MNNKNQIICDHREERSLVPALLEAYGFEVISAQLPVGDYIVSERVAIERKTINDLFSSIQDGRLWEQNKRLREAYPITIVLVEGKDPHLEDASILGALSSLIRRGSSVVEVESPSASAEWIATIARQEAKTSKPKILGVKKIAPTISEQAELVLAVVPGLSLTTAKNLLTHFGSIAKVSQATEKELREVEGIGSKRAAKLAELFSHDYFNFI